eukprot:PLAT9036.6.p1 GENE.PLAT9036.6~~PLAT9036.6.p1  ORF type:complete len:413 (+),score=177.87 PLAT9036.6:800-2038(+)
MLMRYARVSAKGEYSKPPHSKIAYATMMLVRSKFVSHMSRALGKGMTIAVRYSAVRRQFAPDAGKPERQVLDYASQQARLLPMVAAAYAFAFAGRWMMQRYHAMVDAVLNHGDMSALAPMHATSSALKVLTTEMASGGIEEGRKACGGHGYLQASALPSLFSFVVHTCTAEGDNNVLPQQTARYLLKALRAASSGKTLHESVSYLSIASSLLTTRAKLGEDGSRLRKHSVQLLAYQHRAAAAVLLLADTLQQSVVGGASPAEAWNDALVEVSAAAWAHAQLTMVAIFHDKIAHVEKTNAALALVLRRVCDLYALSMMERELTGFVADGFLTPREVPLLRAEVRKLLAELRPDAVALVDSFDYADVTLASALGRYNGRVYETLLAWTQRNPLNKTDVTPPSYRHVLPFTRAKL